MVLFVSFVTFSNIGGKEKKNTTSAIEGLHSTWLIVNNRIRTEKYRVGLAGKENGTGLLFFLEPCARDGSFNFQLPSGLGHHSV